MRDEKIGFWEGGEGVPLPFPGFDMDMVNNYSEFRGGVKNYKFLVSYFVSYFVEKEIAVEK